jgi:flagellar assembly factor FliW
MNLKTSNFGVIEVEEDKIITFKDGIPGFEQYKKYIEIVNQDKDNPFHWLQCIEDSNLAFVVINPFEVLPDYEFKLDKELINELEIKEPSDVKVLSIVVVPEKAENITINLKAPTIINTNSNYGKQYIMDSDKYNVRHNLKDEIAKYKNKIENKVGE